MSHQIIRMFRSSFVVTADNLAVKRAQVVTRLRAYPEMLVAQPLVVAALMGILWSKVAHFQAMVWVALFATYWMVDLAGYLHFRQRTSEARDIIRWLRLSTIMGLVSGLAWGAAVWLLYLPGGLGDETILLTVLNGVAAGAIAVTPTIASSFILFMLGIGLPMVLRMAAGGDIEHQLIAVMLVVYFIFMIRAGLNLCTNFNLALSRGWERDRLNEELEQKRQQAEDANRAKSRFLAAASHDLRQPLQALNLFVEVLGEAVKDPAQHRLVGQINKSVSSLNEMFSQLLNLSRLDAGTVRPAWESVALLKLLDNIHNDFQVLAKSKGLELVIQPGEGLHVYSDPALLERVVRNLVSNAVRYTNQGTVSISAHLADGKVMLEVADTGIGIPENELGKIFDEYYQIQNAHRDRNQGLGLGLAIVRRVTSLLDVELSVESRQDVGTTFRLLIPISSQEAVKEGESPFVDMVGQSLNCTIAMVEDVPEVLLATVHVLQQWGAQVVFGEGSRELLDKMRDAGIKPAIVISDFRLPDNETGLDVVDKVREFCGREIPAMIITGDTGAQELKMLSESGITVLHKPVNIDLMHKTLLQMSRSV